MADGGDVEGVPKARPRRMQASAASSLLRGARRLAVLGGGADGIPMADLSQMAPSDETAQHFLWHELHRHPHIRVSHTGGGASAGAAIPAFSPELVAQAKVISHEWLRSTVCGYREDVDDGGLPAPPGAVVAKVLQAAATGGVIGVLQNRLTKAVREPANKLAYQLSHLEHEFVLRRHVVYLSSLVKRSIVGGAADSHADEQYNTMRTNLVRLPMLRQGAAQTVAAPLSHYARGDADQSSLLSRMVDALSRAPGRMLPTRRLRRALDLSFVQGRRHSALVTAWSTLKLHALSTGLIEELKFSNESRNGRRSVRRAIRLLSHPVQLRNRAHIDRPPIQQVASQLGAAGAQGVLPGSFTKDLRLQKEHTTSLLEACVADLGITRRPEQIGRTKSFRYFARGVVAVGGLPAVDAPGQGAAGGKSGKRARADTMQLAQRK